MMTAPQSAARLKTAGETGQPLLSVRGLVTEFIMPGGDSG